MPGPKMGPRPPDFDEEIIKCSPTYIKWSTMQTGEKLRYACREFTKGSGDDEERLMRRIMIARRNNIRDHETLKRARKMVPMTSPVPPLPPVPPLAPVKPEPWIVPQQGGTGESVTNEPATRVPTPPPLQPQQQQQLLELKPSEPVHPQATDFTRVPAIQESSPSPSLAGMDCETSAVMMVAAAGGDEEDGTTLSEDDTKEEMDVSAVESTRSYRAWNEMPLGAEFVYNQRYVKGAEGHDWLLRKNIWRRMRYRRENKRLVARLRRQQQNPNAPPAREPPPPHEVARQRPPSSVAQVQQAVAAANTAITTTNNNNKCTRSAEQVHHPLRRNSLPSQPEAGQVSLLESPSKGLVESDKANFRESSSLSPHTSTTADPLDHSSDDHHEAGNHHHHDNAAALQASVAAAVAILEAGCEQHVIMDPDAVAAAVAAAETFRSSSDDEHRHHHHHHQEVPDANVHVHDPILAVAVASSAVVPASHDDDQAPLESHESDVMSQLHGGGTGDENNEILVHDPLQAAALAAQLAAVAGSSADEGKIQAIDL